MYYTNKLHIRTRKIIIIYSQKFSAPEQLPPIKRCSGAEDRRGYGSR
jgi:hypothetical protein